MASGSGQNCLIYFPEVEPVKCIFGASNSSKTVVLFGDSHADQWSTPLAQLATEQGWQLITLLRLHGPWTASGKYAVTYEEWADGLRRSLQHLRTANVPVLLLRDSPSPGKNIGNCIASSRWRGIPEASCNTLRPNALDPKISLLESTVAASVGARFGDLSAEFCDSNVCPGVQSGTPKPAAVMART